MPKTNKRGDPKTSELPSPVRRSAGRAQATFAKAHDAALDEYGDEQRAHQVAYSALKRTHERVGDKWVAKPASGPSDSRAAQGRGSDADSAGGVNAEAPKKHLYEVARTLDIAGRSTMRKAELVKAIRKANDQANEQAREQS